MEENSKYSLDRSQLLKALAAAACDKEPRNILLAGPWGSGKTWLLERLEQTIRKKCPKQDIPYVIFFSPWSSVSDGDPRTTFLRCLYDELAFLKQPESDEKDAEKIRAWGRVGNLLGVLKDILNDSGTRTMLAVLDPLAGASTVIASGMIRFAEGLLKNKQDTVDAGQDSPEPPIKQMRKQVGQILSDITLLKGIQSKRILLLVDDLDRARPEEAVAVLDSLYHLFMPHADGGEKNWPLTSIWAVNTTVLEEYLYREYRELPSFDPNAYLEKLFWQRINVPPLIENGKQGDATRLWEQTLYEATEIVCSCSNELAKTLSTQVNYAILGNLRLHARVRRDCIRLWCSNNSGDSPVRNARLVVLVDAFPYFREQIAPFNGMWPHFFNQVNKRLRDRPMEWIANPLYRHVDSPDLHTLLEDLGVLQYSERLRRYEPIEEGRTRLQQDLARLWKDGI